MSARDSGQAIRPNRSLTSHSGLLILDRDGQQQTILPPQSRTTSTAATPPSVLLALSASIYPIPKAQSRNLAVEDRVPPYGGFFVNEQEIENDDGHFTPQPSLAPLSSLVQNNSPKRDLIKPGDKTEFKPAPKRGRPRKIVNLDDAGSNEHRRTQLRLAQRAYRRRKETKISTLEDRIAELENTIKRMGGSHEPPGSALSQ